MKWIHIVAGLLALLAGAVALYSFKGSKIHRRSGTIFVYAMLVMSGLGAVMAALEPARISVVAGVLTFYLVSTGLLTVKRGAGPVFRWIDIGAMLLALTVGIAAFKLGFEASNSPKGTLDGLPAAPAYMFGVVALLAASLDLRMLLAGGIQGAHRLARHLWRMGFALWIATASFFLGQAKLFPAPLRKGPLLAVPVLLVLVTMFYYLVRVLRKKWHARALVTASGIAPRRELAQGKP